MFFPKFFLKKFQIENALKMSINRQSQFLDIPVAGVAVFRLEISKSNLISLVSAIRSLLANVRTLLSSITVFNDSIHIGSMSPSRTIHLGLKSAELFIEIFYSVVFATHPAYAIFACSLIILENKPSRHSLVDAFMTPKSSSLVTAFGFMSWNIGRLF